MAFASAVGLDAGRAGACSTSSKAAIDHQILGIHHVRAGDGQIWWDMGFLALGAVLVIGGYVLQRGSELPIAAAGSDPA